MEPYTLAEQLYQVHGNRGEDPTEPPASAPYPFPAVSHEPRIQQLADDLAAAGQHPFHAPCGVMLDKANPPTAPASAPATCDGFPCLIHAKSDAEVLGAAGPGAPQRHPDHQCPGGQAGHRRRRHRRHRGRGRPRPGPARCWPPTCTSSCGAANSARLLLALRPAKPAYPNGLANGSDQVGRNYMFHNSQAVLALSKEPSRPSSRRPSRSTTSTSGATTSSTP